MTQPTTCTAVRRQALPISVNSQFLKIANRMGVKMKPVYRVVRVWLPKAMEPSHRIQEFRLQWWKLRHTRLKEVVMFAISAGEVLVAITVFCLKEFLCGKLKKLCSVFVEDTGGLQWSSCRIILYPKQL